ncbi:MAG TPA: hypothetical protein VH207_01795 [Chthoniobacterales bacterium]|jgi:hypothetical protein|nr:hypothetical protein [Chthoniobacterales bacterium]
MFRSLIARGLALLFFLGPAAGWAAEEEAPNESAAKLSTLGRKPDWGELERYQGTMTHDEFLTLLNSVYATHGFDPALIEVQPEAVRILTESGTRNYFTLRFAKSEADRLPLSHWWKAPRQLSPTGETKPLADLHIALDPGHLGGAWAKMEERWFKIGDAPPVQEGDMTLRVAQLLAPRLESLGAKVSLVRAKAEPIAPYRPSDFTEPAREFLRRAGIVEPRENFDGPADPEKEQTVTWQRELLFYRNSEIRRRASLVNYRMQPDLVLCIHFNAEPWGDPNHPTLSENNHLHLLVNGSYLPSEIGLDDERFEMLQKLLSRAFPEELELAETLAGTMGKATGLPPYHYKTENVTPVGTSGYVYARNLMATRLYRCPTVYLEPYVMNSRVVFPRVKAGDYEGTRTVAGKMQPSIYREYVESVVAGVLEYFKKKRL